MNRYRIVKTETAYETSYHIEERLLDLKLFGHVIFEGRWVRLDQPHPWWGGRMELSFINLERAQEHIDYLQKGIKQTIVN